MAFEKEYSLHDKLVKYWIISSYTWDKNNDRTIAIFRGYKDKDSRKLGLDNHMTELTMAFSGTLNVPEIYVESKNKENLIKGRFFHDAIDC